MTKASPNNYTLSDLLPTCSFWIQTWDLDNACTRFNRELQGNRVRARAETCLGQKPPCWTPMAWPCPHTTHAFLLAHTLCCWNSQQHLWLCSSWWSPPQRHLPCRIWAGPMWPTEYGGGNGAFLVGPGAADQRLSPWSRGLQTLEEASSYALWTQVPLCAHQGRNGARGSTSALFSPGSESHGKEAP